MTLFILLLAVLWIIRIVGNVLSFVHLWWVKEYRWDRMFIHLKTPQGKRVYFLPWRWPHLSPKSVMLVGLTLGTLAVAVFYSGMPALPTLFIMDVISFPLTFVFVGLVNLPVRIYHQYVISRARTLLRAQSGLMVIGITGSYGKTSTKEYLSAILSTKYKTLKTAASKNAPIGISEVVVSSLQRDHNVFVVEMGAYKKGEIAYMADLVRPQIAVVTAINEQHQDLFGTIERTMQAKYELVSGLTGKRIAILNADDTRVREMGVWAMRDGASVWWYGKNDSMPKGEKLFYAKDIRTETDRVRFTCVTGNRKAPVNAHVVGTHQVSNILAAIAASVAAGMPLKDACLAASALRPAKSVLERIRGIGKLTLIDDTFNNNPDAAIAALDVLSMEKHKRILVFQPMIELGAYAHSAHNRVGVYAAGICDAIILTNASWSADFIRGVRSVSKDIPVSVMTPSAAAAYIKKFASGGGTVLCKGKESLRVLALLRNVS